MSLTTSRVTTTEITSPFVHTTSLMVNNHDVTDAMNYLYTITDASSLTSKLQAGSGITIANGVISAGITGSGTISGTSNQVIVTNNSGASVLSLPQNIHTGASPTFAGLTIGATDVTNSLTYLANVSNATTLASKLTAGNGISISAGSIINNGVTQLSGTSNQVNVSGSSGSITLSLPQNIHTSATPTFAGLTIGANSLTAALDFLFNVTDATTLASKLTAGTGIAISAGTITNNGVTQLAGTSNQVNVSGSSGSITLSLPQNIHTSATPTFAGLSIGATNVTTSLTYLADVINATTLGSKLTAGTGISISSGVISSTSPTTMAGTTNQVNVSTVSGTSTFSLPQNIHTTASPQFTGINFYDGSSNKSSLLLNGGTFNTEFNVTGGNLWFKQSSGKNIEFFNSSNASIVKLVETTGVEFSKHVYIKDSSSLRLGDAADFQIWHDGSTTNYILTGQGRDLVFKSEGVNTFNYKFQNHNNVDLLSISGAGDIRIPGFSTANRIITTSGTSGLLAASLAYATTADANSIAQRDSGGNLTASTLTSSFRTDAKTSASTDPAMFARALHASYADTIVKIESVRSGSGAFNYWKAHSQGDDNARAYLTGDGQLYIDGTVNSPADIAEYFESTDATAFTVGRTVILSGGKVRYYNAATDTTDQIIGVVRPKGSGNGVMLVGNAYSMYWSQKFLTDDYDAVILNGAGEWTKNPSFDPNATYVPREQRTEWNLIGLLGQIKITNGQTVNPRWILMTSGTVASKYLVR